MDSQSVSQEPPQPDQQVTARAKRVATDQSPRPDPVASEASPPPPGHDGLHHPVMTAARGIAAVTAVTIPAVKTSRFTAFLVRAYTSEHAIYGTVLVSALIAVGWRFETDLDVFEFLLGTVFVFWLAHLYSGVIARPMIRGHWALSVWHAIVKAARHSIGMILAMLLPCIFLLLPSLNLVDEYTAYYIALWIGVGILALLGYVNSARRGSPVRQRIISALVTSAFGLFIIWLSALVH
jgi:hypothetical protein